MGAAPETMGRIARIREAFCRALELGPSERVAFLSALPPELREEISSLLTAHESAGGFLHFSEDAARAAGERIGPYRIVELIGQGGMADVYRACRDDGEFDREVAIKLVGGRLFAPEAARRFIAERRILALLDHPNIVRMIDGGVWQGQRYLVMELIEGEPVTGYCARRKLSISERLRIFQAICGAIHYAHQRLVIHRDLKPGNILINTDGQVKVLDFGIARLLENGGPDDLTATLLNPFTLACASPEQVRGEPLTVATDIYSLGLLLYELLTGRNPQASGIRSEIENRILDEDPPPPAKIAPGLSPDVDAIVLKALAKDPTRRYASVERLSADVSRYLNGLPVAARTDSILYRTRKFVRRRAVPLAAFAVLTVTLLLGALFAFTQWRRAERRFNEQRSLAHSVLFEIYDSIGASPGSLPARRLLATRARQYLDNLSRDAGDDSSLKRELAAAYLRLGDVQGRPYHPNLGDTAGALESYRKAVTFLEPELARHPTDAALQEEVTDAYMDVGQILMRQYDAQTSIELARRVIGMMEKLVARFPGNLAYHERLSRAYLSLGEGQSLLAWQSGSLADQYETLASYRKALAILEDNSQLTDRTWQVAIASTYFFVSYGLRGLAGRTGDLSYYRQALDSALKGNAMNRSIVAADPKQSNRRNLADGLIEIATLRSKCCQDFNGALRDANEALGDFQQIAGQDPQNVEARRDVANAERVVGDTLGAAGHLKEAREADLKALAIYQQVSRADPDSQEDANYIAMIRAQLASLKPKN